VQNLLTVSCHFHSIVILFLLTDVAAGLNLGAVLNICCST